MKYLLVIVAALASSSAAAQDSLARETPIEDRSQHALDRLHEALRGGRARLLFWGASHVASDQYTGFLREEWQRRFGDGGPGFVLPARPYALYAHQRALIAPAGAFRVLRARTSADAYGPSGLALESSGEARAFVEVRGRPVESVAIHYQRRSDGGSIEVRLRPGGEETRISSRGPSGVEVRSLRSARAIRRVEIRTIGDGTVRLFGVSMDREEGVRIDALGIPGAQMRERLRWQDEPLAASIAALAPDLIVLAYGTNESGIARAPLRDRSDTDEAVRRARALAPRASCLLIGPSEWPVQRGDGTWAVRPRTREIAAIQRDAAARHGCGFFDLAAVTGGAMPRWVQAGLALEDYVHFTDEGHRLIAGVLSRALLRGYRASPL